MTFSLSQHSLARLEGLHPDLIAVIKLAITITRVDFAVVQGLRTKSDEAKMVAEGKSSTMHSRHLPNKQGLGCAADLGAFVNGAIDWDNLALYRAIDDAMQAAAKTLGIPVEYGGNWTTFKDSDHWQLPWAQYP